VGGCCLQGRPGFHRNRGTTSLAVGSLSLSKGQQPLSLRR